MMQDWKQDLPDTRMNVDILGIKVISTGKKSM